MKTKLKIIIPAIVLIFGALWFFTRTGDFLYSGTVEADEIDISSRLSAIIKSYGAQEGESVKKGQIIVSLECDDIRLAADIAKKDFDRAQKLLSAGSYSRENYDRLKYLRDESALKLSWCEIAAPIGGKMLYKYREPGELVSPGVKLATVSDLSSLYVYFYVSQPMLAKLKLGQDVAAFLPEAGMKKFTGKIEHINDEAEFTPRNVQTRKERQRLVYGIKTRFQNHSGELKPGMTLEAQFPAD